MSHLWEIDHPYYGADSQYGETGFDTFDELREAIEDSDEDMNHVYRWDWLDWAQPHHDALFLDGEDRSKQEFKVFVVMPRKSQFLVWTCPITHEQEPEVLALLRSERVLGSLRTMWEPILDTVTPT